MYTLCLLPLWNYVDCSLAVWISTTVLERVSFFPTKKEDFLLILLLLVTGETSLEQDGS